MNYKKILVKGFDEYKTQRTPYVSYFKRKAKKANSVDSIEFAEFFNGCMSTISDYKKDIESQYNKDLKKNDWALDSYIQMLSSGETIAENGQFIQSYIERIENEKAELKESGFTTNNDYRCYTTEFGEITETYSEKKFELSYLDIELIEKSILQTVKELSQKNIDNIDNFNISKKQELNTDILVQIITVRTII